MKYKHDEIIRAWLDDKQIQYKVEDVAGNVTWVNILPPGRSDRIHNFSVYNEYRIKPEQRRVTWWILIMQNGDYRGSAVSFSSKEDALRHKNQHTNYSWVGPLEFSYTIDVVD